MAQSADTLARIRDLSTPEVEALFARAETLETRARHLKLLALNVLDVRKTHEGSGAVDTEGLAHGAAPLLAANCEGASAGGSQVR